MATSSPESSESAFVGSQFGFQGDPGFEYPETRLLVSRTDEIALAIAFGGLPVRIGTEDRSIIEAVLTEDGNFADEAGVKHEEIAGTLEELCAYVRACSQAGKSHVLMELDRRPNREGMQLYRGERMELMRFPGHERAYPLGVMIGADGIHTITDLRDGASIHIHSSLLPLIRKWGYYGAHTNRSSPHEIARVLEIGDNRSLISDDDPVRQVVAAQSRGGREQVVISTCDQLARLNAVAAFYPRIRGNASCIPRDKTEAIAMRRLDPDVRIRTQSPRHSE